MMHFKRPALVNALGTFTQCILSRIWEPRSPNEKCALLLAAPVLLIAAWFWGVWQPLQVAITQQRAALHHYQQLSRKLAAVTVSLTSPSAKAENVSSALDDLASRQGITIERVYESDSLIQVWLEPVAFSALLQWLYDVREEQGLQVNHLEVVVTQPGVVIVSRLELLPPS